MGRGRAALALAVSGRGKRLRRMLPPHSVILPMRLTRVVLSTCYLDHDPQNDAAGNLADLCQRCHLLNEARNTNPAEP